MLVELMDRHRAELIARTRERVSVRRAPRPDPAEMEFGIPLFLMQPRDYFLRERSNAVRATVEGSAPRSTGARCSPAASR